MSKSEAIVVGTDGSDTAKRAVDEAVRLAKLLQAPVHLVSAYEPLRDVRVAAPGGAAQVWHPVPDAQVEATLQEGAAAVRFSGLEVETHAVRGDPADALLEIAEKVDATLIVVGNQGMHGAKRFKLGNVPNKVSHRARCNVLIVATDEA